MILADNINLVFILKRQESNSLSSDFFFFFAIKFLNSDSTLLVLVEFVPLKLFVSFEISTFGGLSAVKVESGDWFGERIAATRFQSSEMQA